MIITIIPDIGIPINENVTVYNAMMESIIIMMKIVMTVDIMMIPLR